MTQNLCSGYCIWDRKVQRASCRASASSTFVYVVWQARNSCNCNHTIGSERLRANKAQCYR
jgi:hypothetical protein